MVPARSNKVSRVSLYSGFRSLHFDFAYEAFTLSGWLSQNHSAISMLTYCGPNPGSKLPVCPLPLSLAATQEIDVSFSSSGYLDVSVPRVPSV